MKFTRITSTQNPQIKAIAKLGKSSRARKEGVFITEGCRLIGRALLCEYELIQIVSCDKLCDADTLALADKIKHSGQNISWLEVEDFIYNSLSYRDSGCGLMAVFRRKSHTLNDVPRIEHGFYMVLESPEKPGNIGAVCRSADAAGAAGVIVCNAHTDPYNPNALTASTGTIFSIPLAMCDSCELLTWLETTASSTGHPIRLLAAICDQESVNYVNADYGGAVAIAVGTEHEGLSDSLASAAHQKIHIPMSGQADSLNASTAAAILMFEAARQQTV